jgi:hypothetical protein
MTLTPMYEAIKRETSRKTSIREKHAEILGTGHQCKDGLLPSSKRHACESVEMFKRIVRYCPSGIVSLLIAFSFAMAFMTSYCIYLYF